jgi:hypothetical protein
MDLNYKSAELDKIYEMMGRLIAKVDAPQPSDEEIEPVYQEMKRWYNNIQQDMI